ncbi:hypothetical protein PC129_g20021 [Phytophthora cactorum]|uniref:Uncharacterized protein n=1 Tax=Phytophthora cactorum TaxID=29920 RepID=A0A8T1H9R5_9STRA|nr:hypothetical protein Pcac1_g27466 [Phytophthora cactorum]KAG2837328.1 hypothetical protein PC113_g19856 [Phytophthora cactorum]KAG2890670.1 hypothetical protein PC115_g19429 [Phytophthora cactorum]KAG2894194.1 hypothetical protein PC114_g15994 [Phytophthora cactorum]KAG2901833.1 hypothetical protein PC117_g21634 [Phytophthora cactorum]
MDTAHEELDDWGASITSVPVQRNDEVSASNVRIDWQAGVDFG